MDIKVVIGQMIVLFALMGLGFLLYRVNILDLSTNSKLTSLVFIGHHTVYGVEFCIMYRKI